MSSRFIHGDDGRDVVDVCQQHPALSDPRREEEGADRLALLGRHREGVEERDHPVGGDGLEESRRACAGSKPDSRTFKQISLNAF